MAACVQGSSGSSRNALYAVSIAIGRVVSRAPDSKDTPFKVRVDHLNFYYGPVKVLHDISVHLHSNQVSAFIGPSCPLLG